MKRGGRRILLVLLVAVLALTSCLPPPLPRVIKLGLVAPFEGRYRYIGYDAIYAARLAVREINAAGGVGGYRLELVAYDDRGEPEAAVRAAHNLALDPTVMAVIGHYRPATTAAALDVYAAAELPLITINGWLTETRGVAWQLSPHAARWAAAAIGVTRGAPSEAALWGEDSLAAALAVYGATDTADTLPEVIFSTLPPVSTAARLRGTAWSGVLVGGPALLSAEWAALAGDALAATHVITPYPLPTDIPGTEAWRAAYQAVGPHVPEPGLYALPTYEAIYLLAEALTADVAARRTPTRAGLLAVLPETRRAGWLGEIVWTQDCWATAPLYHYAWDAAAPRLAPLLE